MANAPLLPVATGLISNHIYLVYTDFETHFVLELPKSFLKVEI